LIILMIQEQIKLIGMIPGMILPAPLRVI